MSDPRENAGSSPSYDDSTAFNQEVRLSQISALVPEHVRSGIFSTGVIVMQGPHEFVVDFLLRMTQPHQVAARVVLAPSVLPQFISTLQENLKNYEKRFGPPPVLPKSQPREPKPSVEELYDRLKMGDEVMSGVYANAVMVGHTAAEFSFDFITNFFPRSAVSRRVYLAAPHVTQLLESLNRSWMQYRQKLAAIQAQQRRQQAEPASDGETNETPEED